MEFTGGARLLVFTPQTVWAESLLIQPCLTEEWTGKAPFRSAAKNVLPILYRWLDFEAF